jgi:hypothetical protein
MSPKNLCLLVMAYLFKMLIAAFISST